MAQSLSNLLIHIVFSTKDRKPLILPEIESQLYPYITKICIENKSRVIQIGGVTDHLHLLVDLGRTTAVSDLIGDIKANSSRWIKKKGEQYHDFAWQGGYGAFSIGKSGMIKACKYISNQKQHHGKISFQDEFLKLLNKYDVEYDPRYVWD